MLSVTIVTNQGRIFRKIHSKHKKKQYKNRVYILIRRPRALYQPLYHIDDLSIYWLSPSCQTSTRRSSIPEHPLSFRIEVWQTTSSRRSDVLPVPRQTVLLMDRSIQCSVMTAQGMDKVPKKLQEQSCTCPWNEMVLYYSPHEIITI